MTAAKDSVLSRNSAQGRFVVGSPASTAYKAHPKPNSHCLSVPSSHRVSRRKSASSNAAGREAAMAAAIKELSGNSFQTGRRGSKSGKNAFPASMPNGSAFGQPQFGATYESAVVDGTFLEVLPEDVKNSTKARARRASEGSVLRKEGKRVAGGELRCETCGKGYKHSSCLNKHLWEHTPEWQITSKLLISKHQQVQLLEAASVLVAMNAEGVSASAIDSDTPSPADSSSSNPADSEMSSFEMTPPPQDDGNAGFHPSTRSELEQKRYSANSSAYSQSYQSSVFSESAPHNRNYISHYRQWSTEGRPATSGTSVNGGEDQESADLSAAVGLLSCSYGTSKSGNFVLPADAPPVPPLPSRFLGSQVDGLSGTTLANNVPQAYSSYMRETKDVDMDADASDDESNRHRAQSNEEDEGMFGRMEE